jgi:phosphoglycolate phosphatase-like HAD superfamily hydrolase
VFNDEDCPRCGWTAPGPVGDARDDALAAEAAMIAAEGLGWVVLDGGQPLGGAQSLAA